MIEQTKLWQEVFVNSLFNESDKTRSLKERLKQSLLQMRNKVITIVEDINSDMNGITVHDINHLDSLWEMASLLYRDEQKFNPTELFILGAAILIHDAGLALSAYPNRMEEIIKTQEWRDSLTIEYRKIGIFCYKEDYNNILTSEAIKRCTWRTLRLLHSKVGVTLISQGWDWRNEKLYLLEDSELRSTYSEIIGLIANSHNWPIYEVQNKLGEIIGAFPGGPTDWTIDSLKLACILRLSDAIQIDSRRAPLFRFVLNSPEGIAKNHWDFQSKMSIPQVRNNKLIFTSSSSFNLQYADAWWLCYDWIQMINKELKDVNTLMIETNRKPFTCDGVSNSESPTIFSKVVKVSNWVPIDTTLKVTDVSGLVKRLGGSALYDDKLLAIRELVQNSCDAIKARKTLFPEHKGKISISFKNKNGDIYLSVEDNGIGMSSRVMTTSLLDFGKSFWNSEDVFYDHPSLISKGFIPEGRFGIGFFSSFMLGDKIVVTSRRYDYSFSETIRLEFRSGLSKRPVLLKTDGEDLPLEGGTRVEILLFKSFSSSNIANTLRKMFPALEITLELTIDDVTTIIINGGDWKTISSSELFQRTETNISDENYPLILIEENDKIYGRAAVCHHGGSSQDGIIVDSHGIKICKTSFFPGIVKGIPLNAARTKADMTIPKAALSKWATKQSVTLNSTTFDNVCENIYAATQILCAGGILKNMPFLSFRGKAINMSEFINIIQDIKEYWVFYESYFVIDEMALYKKNPAFYNWLNSNIVFRITPFFGGNLSWVAGNINRVLEISEVVRKNIIDNPVFEILRNETRNCWGKNYEEKILQIEAPKHDKFEKLNSLNMEKCSAVKFLKILN